MPDPTKDNEDGELAVTYFGDMPDGTRIERLTLQGGGLTASILTYGTVVQDLRLEDHDHALVLGFESFAPYLTQSPYFGATAGRCANRIRGGHLELDGKVFQLDRNFIGKHSLHGGAASFGKRVWSIEAQSSNQLSLTLNAKDGEMGYPGNMTARVTYALLDGGVLDIEMEARSDAPTLCNLAHHSYFNFGSADISDYLLSVDAGYFLPVDDELIPTGETRSVADTVFDFRSPHPIRQAHPVDHNYCLSERRTKIRTVATLRDVTSGVTMQLRTTEPGLQVYDGAKLDIEAKGLDGRTMKAYSGIALEPQVWPDANNQSHFPQAVLRPGEIYKQHTQYIFSKDTT